MGDLMASLIRRLLLSCRPSTIRGLVVAIDINSVDGQSVRPCAHVGEEVKESVSPRPSLAHSDASAAIVLPRVFIGIGTSANHVTPTLICGGIRAAVARALSLCGAVTLPALVVKRTHATRSRDTIAALNRAWLLSFRVFQDALVDGYVAMCPPPEPMEAAIATTVMRTNTISDGTSSSHTSIIAWIWPE